MMDQFKPQLPFPRVAEKFDMNRGYPPIETPRAFKIFKHFVAATAFGALIGMGAAELVKQEDAPASPPPTISMP